ncbi:hypothetical protein FRC04_007541 [Tulasnella sp. 424]|nr:hypothetical protein FRC04_007541 [Tulasnella sp. 424]
MGYFAYDRFAKPYAIDRIIDQSTMRLNATAYEEYSQLYLTVTFSMTYMLAFITPTLLVTHAALNYGPNILGWLRNDREAEANDIHAKLMQRYPDTPTWWYLIEPGLDTPAWVALLAIAQVMVFLLPSIYLYATAGSMVQFTVISQAISGIVLPGRPLPNMLLKTMVPNITFMSLVYLRWLKLGHYMKIPPRANFCVHIVATFVSNFTQVGVKKYLFATVKDICQPGQKSQLTCASIEAFYTASVVWRAAPDSTLVVEQEKT